MDGRVGGEEIVNGVTEEENQKCQEFRHHQGDTDRGPDTAVHFLQPPGTQQIPQQDLGGLGHGDGVHVRHVCQHTGIDLGGDDGGSHEVDKAQDHDLGDVVRQRLRAGGHGNHQKLAAGAQGKGTEIPEGKAHIALAVQRPQHQRKAHRLADAGGRGGPRHPHPGKAQPAVDENGVARHVHEVHHHGEAHHFPQQRIASEHGAKFDVEPLKHHGPAYNAGVEAGAVKRLRRGPQEGEDHVRRQQQNQAHQKAEKAADRHAHGGNLVAGLSLLPGTDVLGQEDGGGGAHGLQHDDDYVHYLVAVSDGGHGGRAEGGDHELIYIAHQQLQQQLRENGQGEVKDPAGLGGKSQCHEKLAPSWRSGNAPPGSMKSGCQYTRPALRAQEVNPPKAQALPPPLSSLCPQQPLSSRQSRAAAR